jgi:hypothetical protein
MAKKKKKKFRKMLESITIGTISGIVTWLATKILEWLFG